MTSRPSGRPTGGGTGETPEAAALDQLLTQAALGPLRRFFPGRPALRFAGALARRPDVVASRAGRLAAELARVARGVEGGDRLRRRQPPHRSQAPGQRPREPAARAGDGAARRLHGRFRPRVEPGVGRTAHRGLRADPVPSTTQVREFPLLIIPPTTNKYYILDLAPGRSMIEYLVSQGQQVFVMSWRNPDARHAAWGFDEYVRAIDEALGAAAGICGAPAVHLLGACSGVFLASLAAAVRQADGGTPGARATEPGAIEPRAIEPRARIASLGLLVTMLDQSRTDAVGALIDEATADPGEDLGKPAPVQVPSLNTER